MIQPRPASINYWHISLGPSCCPHLGAYRPMHGIFSQLQSCSFSRSRSKRCGLTHATPAEPLQPVKPSRKSRRATPPPQDTPFPPPVGQTQLLPAAADTVKKRGRPRKMAAPQAATVEDTVAPAPQPVTIIDLKIQGTGSAPVAASTIQPQQGSTPAFSPQQLQQHQHSKAPSTAPPLIPVPALQPRLSPLSADFNLLDGLGLLNQEPSSLDAATLTAARQLLANRVAFQQANPPTPAAVSEPSANRPQTNNAAPSTRSAGSMLTAGSPNQAPGTARLNVQLGSRDGGGGRTAIPASAPARAPVSSPASASAPLPAPTPASWDTSTLACQLHTPPIDPPVMAGGRLPPGGQRKTESSTAGGYFSEAFGALQALSLSS